MNDTKNNNLSNLKIGVIELHELNSFMDILIEAFFEKLKLIYYHDKYAAYNIIKSEVHRNIKIKRHYAARLNDRVIGILDLVTSDNLKNYSRSLLTYIRYLGFARALKSFTLTRFEIPRLSPKTLYIDNLAVDKNYRNKGIAGKMLLFAEDIARRDDKSALTLWVAADNKNAYNRYKKSGFTDIFIRSFKMLEKYLGYRDWIYMKKEIL
ncbi:MAG: GNAT family N-acetyltransferase [Actinomycetota bacterium]|nr:GNAT family N-acetyltransferase [Actinomycetota bacterium]